MLKTIKRGDMKRESIIFLSIFIILSLAVHSEQWFSTPLEHIANLSHSTGYGMGAFHPLGFTLLAYLGVSLLLSISKKIKNIFTKSN